LEFAGREQERDAGRRSLLVLGFGAVEGGVLCAGCGMGLAFTRLGAGLSF
jgi:hypothetical protein